MTAELIAFVVPTFVGAGITLWCSWLAWKEIEDWPERLLSVLMALAGLAMLALGCVRLGGAS